jgi:hypothetical protein
MQAWEAWNAWKLRTFLLMGLTFIILNHANEHVLRLGIPHGLDLYLIVASFYFSLSPQKRVATSGQKMFVFLFFPGAFVTTLVPLYAALLSVARYLHS